MLGSEFGELSAFMAVAEQRSFTRAAKQLGVSAATLSATIRHLEDRLGIRLLNRTTRSVATTEAGERLLTRLHPLVQEFDVAVESLNDFRDKPAGLLRLSVAPVVAEAVLAPKIAKFLIEYPDIRLEISADSANIDIVAEQFDAGIRASGRIDQDMIAVRITEEWRSAVVAAPAYLSQRGVPKVPEDLLTHDCVRMRLAGGVLLPWRFQRDGERFDLSMTGRLIVNDGKLVLPVVLDGAALAQIPRATAEGAIKNGQLVSILEETQPVLPSFALYYPSRRQTPAALKALIEFLRPTNRTSG